MRTVQHASLTHRRMTQAPQRSKWSDGNDEPSKQRSQRRCERVGFGQDWLSWFGYVRRPLRATQAVSVA